MKMPPSIGKRLIVLITILVLSFLSLTAMAQNDKKGPPPTKGERPPTQGGVLDITFVEPTKLFDNLAYVGYKGTGSFVINTSDGLIIIDTIWRYTDAPDIIVPGIEKLGWDPEDIKYVLLTHEHGDHYGSAKYFEDIYGAKVFISKIGWIDMWRYRGQKDQPPDPWGKSMDTIPLITKFNELKDKQELTLGDTTITVIATPGHTLGSMSFIIPVTDKGVPHKMAVWGGTGFPKTIEHNKIYLNSVNYFQSVANAAGVDAEASIHPFSNNLLDKIDALHNRKPGDPNPVVIGNAGFNQYFDQQLKKGVTTRIAELEKKEKESASEKK